MSVKSTLASAGMFVKTFATLFFTAAIVAGFPHMLYAEPVGSGGGFVADRAAPGSIQIATDRGSDGQEESGWHFELTPYLWASGFNGTTRVGPLSAETDASFSDLVEKLNGGASLRLEASKNNWLLIFDGMYMSLGDEIRKSILGAPFGADVEVKMAIVDGAVGYRVLSTPVGSAASSANPLLNVDVFGGLRFRYFAGSVDFLRISDRSASIYWVEPMGGARIALQFGHEVTVGVRGDISGGTIGVDSSFMWNVWAGIDYRPWEDVSFKVGYRIQGMDLSSGSGASKLSLEAQMKGPAIGVTFHF